jgi:hypothetical protein
MEAHSTIFSWIQFMGLRSISFAVWIQNQEERSITPVGSLPGK